VVTEWRWTPDGGSSVVLCNYPTNQCNGFPVTQSGVMRVTATVNGVTKVQNVRVIVQCMLSPAVSADSAFARIANDTLTRIAVRMAWDSAHVNLSPGNRRERAAIISQVPGGVRRLWFNTPPDPNDTPCSNFFAPAVNLSTDSIFNHIHVHPFPPNARLPYACWRFGGRPTTYGIDYGGPSPNDYHFLLSYPSAYGTVADSTNIYVYRADTSMRFDSTQTSRGWQYDLLTPWQPFVRQYLRRQSSCAIYGTF
jgi:hypothetical protein